MRKLRVYSEDGGFTIEIPDEARVTFGYFNPAAAGNLSSAYHSGDAFKTMKMTALRIYQKTGAKSEDQIACFLGVTGFRDLSTEYVKLFPNDEL